MAGSTWTTREWFSWYFRNRRNQRTSPCSCSCLMSRLKWLSYPLYYSTWVFQLLSWSCQSFDLLEVHHHWSLLQVSGYLKCMGGILEELSSLLRNTGKTKQNKSEWMFKCNHKRFRNSSQSSRTPKYTTKRYNSVFWRLNLSSISLRFPLVFLPLICVFNRVSMMWQEIFLKSTFFLKVL